MQAQAMLYPKLISMNTLNFSFEGCNFTEKLMLKRDKKGVSREGAGRVAIHRDCPGLVYSYTLECSYCAGVSINKIEQCFDKERRRFLLDSEPVLDPNSYLYPTASPDIKYNTTIFHDIGRACLTGVLDLVSQNPLPRVTSLQHVKGDLLYAVME